MATIMIRLRALETTFCPRSEDIVYEVQSPGGQDSEHYKNKVSTCQDTYMYIFIYAYTCTCTSTSTCTCTSTCISTRTCTCTRTCRCRCACKCLLTRALISTHVHIQLKLCMSYNRTQLCQLKFKHIVLSPYLFSDYEKKVGREIGYYCRRR